MARLALMTVCGKNPETQGQPEEIQLPGLRRRLTEKEILEMKLM